MKTKAEKKKNRRLLKLFALYGIADLAKSRKPVKTAVKMAAVVGRIGARSIAGKGKKAAAGTRLAEAVSKAASYRSPKEIRRRKRRRKVLHLLLRKLA